MKIILTKKEIEKYRKHFINFMCSEIELEINGASDKYMTNLYNGIAGFSIKYSLKYRGMPANLKIK